MYRYEYQIRNERGSEYVGDIDAESPDEAVDEAIMIENVDMQSELEGKYEVTISEDGVELLTRQVEVTRSWGVSVVG
ncbi:MAG: hypothetical protein HRU09_00960 [Oligoflexales bacterium]|nr:hypothetical protein [Oligoflexales bacterium]